MCSQPVDLKHEWEIGKGAVLIIKPENGFYHFSLHLYWQMRLCPHLTTNEAEKSREV